MQAGWGGRIRTSECRNQNPVPYHLATPQREAPTLHEQWLACQPKLRVYSQAVSLRQGFGRQPPLRAQRRLVGERGFEPPAPTSRTWCSTRLSYSPQFWPQQSAAGLVVNFGRRPYSDGVAGPQPGRKPADLSYSSAFRRATSPSHQADGLGLRAKVARS